MNIKQLKQSLTALFTAKITPLVVGAHGIGKSHAVKQYCDEHSIGFIDLRLGQMSDVGDLLGLPMLKDGDNAATTRFAAPDWFPTSGSGILFLDEVNRARRDVLQGVFQLVLDRRIHDNVLPEGWHVVCAANPADGDYSVTDISDKALQDRFCHIVLEPSRDEFFAFGRAASFPDVVQAFLADQPEVLEVKGKEIELNRTPSRRSWAAVARVLRALEGGATDDSVKHELLAGLVGHKAATALIAFSRSFETRLSADDVLNNYDRVESKVRMLSEAGRTDALSATTAELLEMFAAIKEISAAQTANLVRFILAMPKDSAYGFSCDLLMHECTRNALGECDELVKYFKNSVVKKVKVKA